MKLSQIKESVRYWPHADRKSAIRQAIRLAAAKEYLEQKGISAIKLNSTFKYAVSTGSVLQ